MSNKELSSNKKLFLNLSASFLAFAVTFGINFFLSPYIVRTVGVEAYGFVNLANNFISYASLISVALNALAGRFISVSIFEKDYEKANKYYSSVFLANCVLSLVMLVGAIVVWIYLEHLIKIPNDIFWDVKILFAAMFLNCIVNTVGSVFSVSTFVANKLYLTSIRNIEASGARAVILVLAYAFCAPKILYLGITTLLTSLYCIIFNYYYIHKLTPYLHIKKAYFDMKAVIELIASGIWNLVTRLGQIFTDGLDLLITNIFISATAMGVLSVAKTIPNATNSIINALVGSFSPKFTELYAEKKFEELITSIKQSMKIMSILTTLPIVVLIVCGEKFFALWQPTQDAKQLQILSIITIACAIFSGGINCLYNLFTVLNKIKMNSIVVVCSGVLSTIVVFILLKTTSLGIYAVAGVSTVISLVRNFAFTAPYGAKCLNLKWYAFYPDMLRPALFVGVSSLIGIFISRYFTSTSWLSLIILGVIVLSISIALGYFIVLNKSDRQAVIGILKAKIFNKIKRS